MRSRTTSGGGGGGMVTAWLLTNFSNTLCNIHAKARENITRTHAKWKAGYFFVAHPVLSIALQFTSKFLHLSLYCLCYLMTLSSANIMYFRCYRWISTYDWWNDAGRRKLKYWKTSLYHCQSVNHKCHMGISLLLPGERLQRSADMCLFCIVIIKCRKL
jgi:hypothetical protein